MKKARFEIALQSIGFPKCKEHALQFEILHSLQMQKKSYSHQIEKQQLEDLQAEIDELYQRVKGMKFEIQKNQEKVISCSHILGLIATKPEYADKSHSEYMAQKYKRIKEMLEQNSESLSKELSTKPNITHGNRSTTNPEYLSTIQNYILLENDYKLTQQDYFKTQIDGETHAFALIDEINDLRTIAQALGLPVPEFIPSEYIEAIYDTPSDADSNSSSSLSVS